MVKLGAGSDAGNDGSGSSSLGDQLRQKKDQLRQQAVDNGHAQAARDRVESAREKIRRAKERQRKAKEKAQQAKQAAQEKKQAAQEKAQQAKETVAEKTPQAAKRAAQRHQERMEDQQAAEQQAARQQAHRRQQEETMAAIAREAGAAPAAGRAVERDRQRAPAFDLSSQQEGAGVEKRQDRIGAQARGIERQFVSETRGIESTEEVRVVREGDTIRAVPTESGVESIRQSTKERLQAQVMAENPGAVDVDIKESGGQFIARPDYGSQTTGQQTIDQKLEAANRTPRPAKNYTPTMRRDAASGLVKSFESGTGLEVPGEGSYYGDLQGRVRGQVSPIARMGISSDQVERAQRGETHIWEQAQQGDLSAQVFTAGETIQQFGSDVGETVGEGVHEGIQLSIRSKEEAAEAALGAAGIDTEVRSPERMLWNARVGGSGATVSKQVGGAAGMVTEAPFLIAGGGVQATSVAGESVGELTRNAHPGTDTLDVQQVEQDFASTLTTASKNQAEFVTDRPVEAGIVFGVPAAISGARAAGRARARLSKVAERTGGEPTVMADGGRARFTDFLADERAQAELSGRSRSKSKTRETVENVEQIDPRQLGKGKPEGRSAGVDVQMGTRRGRSGLESRRSFAEDLRRVKELERQVPTQDLRSIYEFPTQQGTGRAYAASAVGVAGTVEEQIMAGPRERIEQAQTPAVESVASKPPGSQSVADLLGLDDTAMSTELQDAQAEAEQTMGGVGEDVQMRHDQATESAVTGEQGGRGAGRQRGRPGERDTAFPGEQTGQGVATGVDTGTATRGKGRQRTATRQEVGAKTTDIQGHPDPTRDPPQDPRRPRPHPPEFDLPGGASPGRSPESFFFETATRVNPIARLGERGAVNPFADGHPRRQSRDDGRKKDEEEALMDLFGGGSQPAELDFLAGERGTDQTHFPWEG